jgi:hypothetical protein
LWRERKRPALYGTGKDLEQVPGTAPGRSSRCCRKYRDIFGYIPTDAIREVSRELKVPSSEIYGVVTFYGQFHLQAPG